MKIIIIEDTNAIAKAYKQIVEEAGYQAVVASTPSLALKLISDEKFDLMFVDLMLPEIYGVELIEKIRNMNIQTPVIVTTNMGSGYDLEKLNSLGISEIIMKATAGPKEIRNILIKYLPKQI